MVKQLSGLVSDTIKRPVIINGKLMTYKKQPVFLKMGSDYKVRFILRKAGKVEEEIEDGNVLMTNMVDEFAKKYSMFGASLDRGSLSANIDNFTQAIVVKSSAYEILVDDGEFGHIHDGTRQFKTEFQDMIRTFVKEFVVNYYEIYINLINRRLMGGHMPPVIKGHLVSGLYQPMVIKTKYIDCPLKLGEFSWFNNYLNQPYLVEETLETVHDSNRGLEISAISMIDLKEKFGTPCIRELNRAHWILMLYICLLRRLDKEGALPLLNAFPRICKSMEDEEGAAEGTMSFFSAFKEGTDKIQTGMVVRG